MAHEEEVREASNAFYAALNAMVNGDAEQLKAIWAHSEEVTTMHPVGWPANRMERSLEYLGTGCASLQRWTCRTERPSDLGRRDPGLRDWG